MIVFDLKCGKAHQFEVWFRSSADYERQKLAGLLICPVCGSNAIEKAVMAPNITLKSNQKTEKSLKMDSFDPMAQTEKGEKSQAPDRAYRQSPDRAGAFMEKREQAKITQGSGPVPRNAASSEEVKALEGEAVGKMLQKLRQHVEKNFESVGKNFAEEARKIHYGEAQERGIYGEASLHDLSELADEGIDVLPLPAIRHTDA